MLSVHHLHMCVIQYPFPKADDIILSRSLLLPEAGRFHLRRRPPQAIFAILGSGASPAWAMHIFRRPTVVITLILSAIFSPPILNHPANHLQPVRSAV